MTYTEKLLNLIETELMVIETPGGFKAVYKENLIQLINDLDRKSKRKPLHEGSEKGQTKPARNTTPPLPPPPVKKNK